MLETASDKSFFYEFGDYRLSPAERQLSRNARPIALTPKAFETLLALVERENRLVTKDELMEIVWGDVIVEEIGLTRNISVLRKVLDDNDHRNPKFIETVSRFGYRFVADVQKISKTSAENPMQSVSLAILPFQTIGLAEEDKYLGLGFADSLITRLSSIKRIVVRPTGSVLQYAGRDRNPLQIGAELDVQFVLDGVLMQIGEDVRITVQGINLASQSSTYGEKFEAKLHDLPRLQDMISEQIAQQILLNMTLEERAALSPKYMPNAQAYQAYLKGRFYLSKQTPQNLWEAFEQFVSATQLDPNFALAYCGLADVYAHLHLRMSLSPASEHLTKARAWLTKALELDPGIAEAHATLGYFAYFYDWNWERAEKEFQKALEISPNDVETHRLYANFLSRKGRFREAHEQIQRALELDSSSFQTLWLKAQIYYREKNFELAWDIGEKLIEEYKDEPKLYHVYLLFGTSYSMRQQHDVALALLRKAETLSMRSFDGAKELIGTFGAAFARAGNTEEAENCLQKLENLAKENDVAYEFATIYANLGEFDKAFEYLNQLIEKRDWRLIHLKAELDFFVLQDDERFRHILKTVGIED
ncbi:MAG TPA: winged helix-turn-helix domain-containing protein [Pyrinomonadaceae bacterium]|jgi:DNA-binding winged helix-turn-helix (wHTH) protein/tetratricopeptide (TPR) repeat protein